MVRTNLLEWCVSERVVIPLAREVTRSPERSTADQPSAMRVIVSDPDALARSAIAGFLTNDGFDVVPIAGMTDCLDAIASEPDAVVVLDPDSLSDAPTWIARVAEQVAVVIFTSSDDGGLLRQMLMAGAAGYLRKPDGLAMLPDAVRAAARGCVIVDRSALHLALDRVSDRADRNVDPSMVNLLTQRELDVLRLVGSGYTNLEIAERLQMSHGTARTHVSHLMTKLGSSHRTQLALLAVSAIGSALPGFLTGS